jgi:hypothetical protein
MATIELKKGSRNQEQGSIFSCRYLSHDSAPKNGVSLQIFLFGQHIWTSNQLNCDIYYSTVDFYSLNWQESSICLKSGRSTFLPSRKILEILARPSLVGIFNGRTIA